MSKLYYKGDIIFLYIRFYDKNNNSVESVKDPKVKIVHTKNGNVYEDLPWSKLNRLKGNEYYFNYLVPYDCDCGLYNVLYYGEIDNNIAKKIEDIHIINKSDNYPTAIKLYGYIDSNNIPLSNVDIEIMSIDNIYNIHSYTHENGYWETYLYPGEYICNFKRNEFYDVTTNIQIGNETNEIQFNNISLESLTHKANGNGICTVTDSCILKNGIPLDGLKIEAFNIDYPDIVNATDITDNKGKWEIHLDPGYYFIKMSGTSMEMEFDKTFRLNISDDLTYNIEDMEDNKAIVEEDHVGAGNGSQTYSDVITDKNGNPIIDVQINVIKNGEVIAETYTDALGKYQLFLDKGTYDVRIYHPSFKDIPIFKITL